MSSLPEPGERKTLICLLALVVLGAVLRVLPYLLNGFHFEIGFDTGTYERILRDYLESPEWAVLPSCPGPPYNSWSNNDPAFFVFSSWLVLLSGTEVNLLFRWVWPLVMGALFQVLVYAACRALTGSRSMGLLATFILALSAVQANAFLESFWKQIFASFLIVLGLLFLDRFLKEGGWRNILLAATFVFGTILYHSAFGVPIVIAAAILLLYLAYKRDRYHLEKMVPVALFLLVVALPLLLVRSEILLSHLDSFLFYSEQGIRSLLEGGANHEGGGGMSGLLGGSVHVTLLYVLFFPSTFLLVLRSFLGRERATLSVYHLMFLFFLVYCTFWLYFSNRFVINLDLLICILAPLGLLSVMRRSPDSCSGKGKRMRQTALTLLVAMFLVSSGASLYYVVNAEPYVTDDEFVQWYQVGLDPDTDFVVSDDRVSVSLTQKGFPSNANTLSTELTENFLLQSPMQWEVATDFAHHYPGLQGKNIIVIIAAWDLYTPLPGGGTISMEDYDASAWYELLYSGEGQILRVYRLIIDW
jgi:hypothetical protein